MSLRSDVVPLSRPFRLLALLAVLGTLPARAGGPDPTPGPTASPPAAPGPAPSAGPAATTSVSAGDPVAGKALYAANCVLCHGTAGKGDGPAASGLPTKPANYSERHSTEKQQINVVTNGGAAEGLSVVMPPWGEALTEQQIRDVVAYVRTELSGNKTAAK